MNDILPTQASHSRYSAMIKKLRARFVDEKDCLYFVHTPVGIINVAVWDYAIPGFVVIRGEDESRKYRFLVFSENEICSFPLEVKSKKLDSSKETLGFKPDFQNEVEEKV